MIAGAPWFGLGAVQVELGVFSLIGLLGGAHCLGMCGPLVTMYADRMRPDGRDDVIGFYEVRQHALFNLGRTVTYATIGAAFGLVGAVVVGRLGRRDRHRHRRPGRRRGGRRRGHPRRRRAVPPREARRPRRLAGGPFGRLFGRVSNRVDDWARGPRIVGLGLLHGILPCPLLYPAFLYDFARGSPVAGALGLGDLGLGTFPTLFCYGTLLGSVSATTRARLHRVLGAAFLLLGWMPLAHGLSLFGIGVPHLELPIYQPLA